MVERARMPGYLRLLALLGLVVVNVQFIALLTDGGFLQARQQFPEDQFATWHVNGLSTLTIYGLFSFMFGVGLAAVRSGPIDTPDHPLRRRARHRWRATGMALGLAGSAGSSRGSGVRGEPLATAAAPIATVVAPGLIAGTARPAKRAAARLLKTRGAGLGIDIGQSICLTFIFCGFGLGLREAIDPVAATLFALTVTLALTILLSLRLCRVAQGRVEVTLRRITFAGVVGAATQREMRV